MTLNVAFSAANPTSSTAKDLTSLAQILHLTHHRNKNQHRLAKWYKSLATLRRQVQKLLSEVQDLDTSRAFSTSLKQGKESKYVTAAREKVEIRVKFWEEILMERWFIAFTNLTADNQYATLGLMLLGCLAKARMVVRPFGNQFAISNKMIDVKPIDMVNLGKVSDFGQVVRREDVLSGENEKANDADADISTVEGAQLKEKGRKSVGEISTRKRNATTIGDNTPGKHPESSASSTPPKNKKRKRKNGDAFDDLFFGLV